MLKNLAKKGSLIISLILFFYVPWASASFEDFYGDLDEYFNESYRETVIINSSVRSSSNTGGNIAESGELVIPSTLRTGIDGGSESSIRVRTIINGEVVEDFEKKGKSNTEKQEIIYNSKIEVIDSSVKIEVKKEINGKVEEIKKEFDLGDKGVKEVNKASTKIEETQIEEERSPELTAPKEGKVDVENREQEKEVLTIFRYINIILDILKNNMDRISKLF